MPVLLIPVLILVSLSHLAAGSMNQSLTMVVQRPELKPTNAKHTTGCTYCQFASCNVQGTLACDRGSIQFPPPSLWSRSKGQVDLPGPEHWTVSRWSFTHSWEVQLRIRLVSSSFRRNPLQQCLQHQVWEDPHQQDEGSNSKIMQCLNLYNLYIKYAFYGLLWIKYRLVCLFFRVGFVAILQI